MDERRIRDVLTPSSAAEIKAQLRAIRAAIAASTKWISERRPRGERESALCNLLSSSLVYIDLYAQNLSGPIPLLAFCTRSVYELNVRARQVLLAPDSWKEWVAESADDYIDIYEAFITPAEAHDSRIKDLRSEVDRLKSVKIKHGLPDIRKADKRLDQVAKRTGWEVEHKTIFKVFSKLVHPTAYLVNSGNAMADRQMRDVLLVYFQIYIHDLFKRIADNLGVPQHLTSDPRKRRAP